jgi:asparagine synthase (glutamine-hydrolysing)
MQDKLPESVLTRKKEGFDIPAHDWLRTVLKPLVLDTLTPDAIGDSGLFRTAAIERIVNDHVGRRANYGYHLWGLLTLFLWMRRWQVRAGALPRSRTQQLHSISVMN